MTANDRFKQSFSAWLWGSMILATLAHFAVLNFWPELTAQDFSISIRTSSSWWSFRRMW